MSYNELYHHGILGMHWGVRRSSHIKNKETASTLKQKTAKPKASKPKTVKEMTDEELRSKVSRLQLEQQYKTLSSTNPAKGKEYIQKTVKAATTMAAVTTTALTLYKNAGKMKEIVDKMVAKFPKQEIVDAASEKWLY